MEDYESIQTFSDEEDGKEDNGDTKSIKAFMLAYKWDTSDNGSLAAIQSDLAPVKPPSSQITYESQAVQVDPLLKSPILHLFPCHPNQHLKLFLLWPPDP